MTDEFNTNFYSNDFDKEKFAEKEMKARRTPLEYWSKEIDPAIMAGDEWVDPKHDFGNKTIENKELEKGIMTQGIFMHPIHDVSYKKD